MPIDGQGKKIQYFQFWRQNVMEEWKGNMYFHNLAELSLNKDKKGKLFRNKKQFETVSWIILFN